jgi:hypothetical protein
MTHERDLDNVLDRWMDDGPTAVADRVIAAAMTDVHTTRQRGARLALLKELFMTMKPAMPVLGIAAAAVVAVVAFQVLAGGGGVGAPRVLTADDLPSIVIAPGEQPEGMGHDSTYDDERILIRPIISVQGTDAIPYLEQPGFVAGRYTEFSDDRAGLLSWAALYETAEDAERGLALYVKEVQSELGYGLGNRLEVDLGDEGAFYDDVDPDDDAQVYLWRSGSLLMAAATYGDFEPAELQAVAEQMDEAAN